MQINFFCQIISISNIQFQPKTQDLSLYWYTSIVIGGFDRAHKQRNTDYINIILAKQMYLFLKHKSFFYKLLKSHDFTRLLRFIITIFTRIHLLALWRDTLPLYASQFNKNAYFQIVLYYHVYAITQNVWRRSLLNKP